MSMRLLDGALILATAVYAAVIGAVLVARDMPEPRICFDLDDPQVVAFFREHTDLTEADVRKMAERQFGRGR